MPVVRSLRFPQFAYIQLRNAHDEMTSVRVLDIIQSLFIFDDLLYENLDAFSAGSDLP